MLDRRQFLKTAFAVSAASFASAGHTFLSGIETAEITHTVRRGDTLSGIAQQFGITTGDLRTRNGLTGDRILIGQKLIIRSASPPARTYTVNAGDTLGKIAADHHTTVRSIQTANNISGDRIFLGQTIVIPGSQASASHRYIAEVMRVTRGIRTQQRPWEYIVAHHSGIQNGNAAIYDQFHRRQRRMVNGLAYHFVIGNGIDSGNGEVEIGDRWLQQLQGGHVSTHHVNEVGIGICLVGNFEERRPTGPQIAALTELIQYLKNDLLGGLPKFTVHREVDRNRTLCPGKNFPTAQMHRLFS